jgi:chromate transporter
MRARIPASWNPNRWASRTGGAGEVLLAFLKLGVSAFGGPLAHLGYFRAEFVVRRRWLDDASFSDLVALCQFLPGPASSQVGFSIGLIRAGYLGGLAAWAGFTLPSAVAMVLFAHGAQALHSAIGVGVLHGLKLVAVAVVAQAVLGMARTMCTDWPRAAIAGVAAVVIVFNNSSIAQIGTLILGGAAGWWLCRGPTAANASEFAVAVSRRVAIVSLALFLVLLFGLPLTRQLGLPPDVALFSAFYRCGALVFGGGHVVLPLLRNALVLPGWVSDGTFLAGYGAAQAVPGPLFTFAAYLGSVAVPAAGGVPGALLGLAGIFLPGLLILIGTLPFWQSLRRSARAQSLMRGINAAVVGLLAAVLYSPLWTGSVRSPGDLILVVIGFLLLIAWRTPPLLVVILGALGGAILGAS